MCFGAGAVLFFPEKCSSCKHATSHFSICLCRFWTKNEPTCSGLAFFVVTLAKALHEAENIEFHVFFQGLGRDTSIFPWFFQHLGRSREQPKCVLIAYMIKSDHFLVLPRSQRSPRSQRKWSIDCRSDPLPNAPGARMTVVTLTPSNNVFVSSI